MCTVGKLFCSTIPSPSKCSEIVEPFGVKEDMQSLLKKNQSLEHIAPFPVQNLILNRITPYTINADCLAQMSICKFHKVNSVILEVETEKF